MQSKWNDLRQQAAPWLLAAFFTTLYLPGVTRYKNLLLLLLLLSALLAVAHYGRQLWALYRQPVMLSFWLLAAAVVYGCVISPDPALSWRAASKPVLVDGLLLSLLLPAALYGQPVTKIAKYAIAGAVCGLCLLLLLDIRLYIMEWRAGAGLLQGFAHRELSDYLLLLVPFLLAAWQLTAGWRRAVCVLLLLLAGLAMLGTMARGAWVAALALAVLWLLYARAWRLLAGGALLAVLTVGAVLWLFPDSTLAYKLMQSDSSYRWGNGTVGTAWQLVQANPWQGYGFGNRIYDMVYNNRVAQHPNWFFKESIGPHNLVLGVWFACGMAGLLALLATWGSLSYAVWQHLRTNTAAWPRAALFAVFAACFAALMVRGVFEATHLNALGWMVALTALLQHGTERSDG